MDLASFTQLLLSGLLLGGIYAMVAVGLALCFGVLGLLNLAHGAFLVLAGFTYQAIHGLGLLGPLSGFLLIPLVFSGLGWLAYRLLLQNPLKRASEDFLAPALLITLGLAFILEEGTSLVWGRSVAGTISPFSSLQWGEFYIPGNRLLVLILMLAISGVLQFWLTHTDSGRRLRALAQDPIGATLVGVSLVRVTAVAFAVSTGLAAVAGLFYVTLFTVSPHLGLPLTLKALFIIVVSGSGSLTRPLVGGLALGTVETLLAPPLGAHWANTLTIVLLLAFLCYRPEGLFVMRPSVGHK
ncbi:MAG: branched-chain amino acid ABC transporter permease [Deltaproteobacteria bacterium]|nr:MAG: branched-chain amino acid ABC transporter permease [Deltaproteobacteria bacterium]